MQPDPEAGAVAGVVLAAGASSRMGQNKLLLQIEGEALVARAAEVHRTQRLAFYRIEVARPEAGGGETGISSFTGTVYIKG